MEDALEFVPVFLAPPLPVQADAEPIAQALDRLALKASLSKPPSWGTAPRKSFFRLKRPHRKPNPPGARLLWPFPRYPKRSIPPFAEPVSFRPPAPTGDPNLDHALLNINQEMNDIATLRFTNYKRKETVPKPEKMDLYKQRTQELWDDCMNHVGTLTELIAATRAAGYNVPDIPLYFNSRF